MLLVDVPVFVPHVPWGRGSMIEVEAVVKRFGSTTAPAGVDLVAEQGRVLALPGPTGGEDDVGADPDDAAQSGQWQRAGCWL